MLRRRCCSREYIAINPLNSNEISIIGATNDFSTFPSDQGEGYFQNINRGIAIAIFTKRELTWTSGFGCFDVNPIPGEALFYDNSGSLFVFGTTNCEPQAPDDFCSVPAPNNSPICPPGNGGIFYQTNVSGNPEFRGATDAFVAGFSSNRNLFYSTYLGGNSEERVASAGYSELSNNLFLLEKLKVLLIFQPESLLLFLMLFFKNKTME